MAGTATTIWNGSQQISGASNDVELTLEEYNALPESKKQDNKNYYIKDAVAEGQVVNGIEFRINNGVLQYRYDTEVWQDGNVE